MDTMSDRIRQVLDATGLSDQKVSERLHQLAGELGLEARGISRESVRQWKSEPDKIPNGVALYLLSRLAGRPMRWFVDGVDDAARSLGDDDLFVLRTWRAQRIDADEAARRLAAAPADRSVGDPGGVAGADDLGTADLTRLLRRALRQANEDQGGGA